MSRKRVRVTIRLLYQAHRTPHGESSWIWFYSGKNRWELGILLPHILRLYRRLAWVWYLHTGQSEQSRALRSIKRNKKGGVRWASLPAKSEWAELDYSGPLKGKKRGMSLTAIEVWMQKSTLVAMVMPSALQWLQWVQASRISRQTYYTKMAMGKAMPWRLRYVCTQYTDTDTEPRESRTSHRALRTKVKDGGYQRPGHRGRRLESCPEQVSIETESK